MEANNSLLLSSSSLFASALASVCDDGGGVVIHNNTDLGHFNEILSKAVTSNASACCDRCFGSGDYPTANAWVRESGVGTCWCVSGAQGTKSAATRTVGFRSGPSPSPSPPGEGPGPVPLPAVLAMCKASVTLDPPGTVRAHSGIIEKVPLGANSTVGDCTALCCLNWNCIAFSYDTVPRICSLKLGLVAIVNTSGPLSVVTGFLAHLAAPPPPFPRSTKFHSNVSFTNAMYYGTEGDTWPTTWLQDGTQLTAAGDRGDDGTHMSMWRVNGTAPDAVGSVIPMQPVSNDVVWIKGGTVEAEYCRVDGVKKNIHNVKPTSLISVEGNVYWGITCMNYGDELLFKRQHNYHAGIAKATDAGGQTWNFSATSSTFFTGRLAAPMFIQFGKDNEDAVDEYVYAHFPYANDQYTTVTGGAESFWNNSDDVILGRVAKTEILNRDSWEFFQDSKTGAATAAWTSNESDAVSVMHFDKMLGMNQVNFHKPSGRYLVANYGFIDLNGLPRPWHQKPAPMRHRTQLMFFEAPQPWGPFTYFHRDDDWMAPDGATGAYCPVFPPKWMTATSALIVSASCCAKTTDIKRHYNFSAQRVDFSFSNTTAPVALPNQRQLDFMELELTQFMHFGARPTQSLTTS